VLVHPACNLEISPWRPLGLLASGSTEMKHFCACEHALINAAVMQCRNYACQTDTDVSSLQAPVLSRQTDTDVSSLQAHVLSRQTDTDVSCHVRLTLT